MDNPNHCAITPASVRYDKGLTVNEVLYGEIILAQEMGGVGQK